MVNVLELGLNVKPVSVLISSLPVAVSTKVRKCAASVLLVATIVTLSTPPEAVTFPVTARVEPLKVKLPDAPNLPLLLN